MTDAVLHPTSRVDDAWEAAYKDSLVLPAWEQTRYLLDAIGARFTMAALGLQDARTVRRWRDDRVAPREHDVAGRLVILYRVTRSIADVYTPAVATAFLRSANPQLEDTSPLMLLRDGDPDDVQKAVLAAARAFLEG
ncbi:MAG: hypothetical protein J2P22_01370 [Nocardioides sp.]|nr:hypothetical protein [Nocardioides sp.]